MPILQVFNRVFFVKNTFHDFYIYWISYPLTVCDILYKKKTREESGELSEPEENDDSEEEEEEEEEGGFLVDEDGEESEVPDFAQASIADIIKMVRKIVTWFNRSPKQTDKLRRYTKEDLKEELTLLKDCKTRWSALFYCLKRFYKIRSAIQYICDKFFQKEFFPY